MDRQTVMNELFTALIATGAEFSVADGAVTVAGLTITCREDYVAVSMEMGQVTNYFRYKTLCYITGRGDQLSIGDSHVGVFSTYKVGREMHLIDESELEENELMDAFLAADIEALS